MNKSVRMPKVLRRGSYFSKDGKDFRPSVHCCGIGYLGNKLLGLRPGKRGSQEVSGKLARLFNTIIFDFRLGDAIQRNDRAKTNEERLAAFRVTCAELGVEIYD